MRTTSFHSVINNNMTQIFDFKITSTSFYDLILTNSDADIIHAERDLNFTEIFLNHSAVVFELAFCTQVVLKKKQLVFYSYCQCDFHSLNKSIALDPFNSICYSNPDVHVAAWYDWFFDLISQHTPRIVTPIFKEGSKKDVKNYRPINILSVCSKVLEKFIFNCLAGLYLSTISNSQFGFFKEGPQSCILFAVSPTFTPPSVTPVVQSFLFCLIFRRHSTRSNTMFYYANSSVLVYQGKCTYFWLTTFQIALNPGRLMSPFLPRASSPQESHKARYSGRFFSSVFFSLALLFADDLELIWKYMTMPLFMTSIS